MVRAMRRLAPLLALAVASCATLPDAEPPRWGVQLYTVREAMAQNPFSTLLDVRALGYDEVEFAGVGEYEPELVCRYAQGLGLSVAAAHADWKQLRDDPQAAVAEAKALCADTIMLAWLPPEERQTLAQWREWIGRLNGIAKLAEAEGMGVAYHAHDFEFAPIDGIRPIDLLMADMDPAIGFEMDTYWVAKAGVDPLDFLRRHADRITHLHLKDMAADGSMADVGTGTLGMVAIIAQARRQGVAHFLVERDDAPDPWASLRASLDSLRAMPLQRATSSTVSGTTPP